MLGDPVITDIADVVGRSPAQVVLRRQIHGEAGRVGPHPERFAYVPA